MADRKPWRVYGARAIEGDYRGQPAAYEAVNSIVAAGIKARVFHWEDSRWCLYEEIEPDEEVAAARAERRRCTLCGDVLKRDEALNLSAWISADVPLPGIGQPGERPGVCRSGNASHVPGELMPAGR